MKKVWLVLRASFSFSTILFFNITASHNAQTLQVYENNIDTYIINTPQEVTGDAKKWIDRILDYIDFNQSILEIGTSFGRDANYIESKGYLVNRSDAAKSFLQYLHEQGHCAQKINILSDDFDRSYDLIFANAVFLHFSLDEFCSILKKIYYALNPPGILAFSVKKGCGEEWSSKKMGVPRYFCYWQASELCEVLMQNNFRILEVDETDIWIRVIASK